MQTNKRRLCKTSHFFIFTFNFAHVLTATVFDNDYFTLRCNTVAMAPSTRYIPT